MDNRFVEPDSNGDDGEFDHTLRPSSLGEMLGQKKVKDQLRIGIEAAKQRSEALDHVLLYGPPGLGKTTLAYVIAHELGVQMYPTSGPLLERPGDLAGVLTSLGLRDVLFIDELDDKSSPMKAKGVGELGICGAGAAVANAIYNATGVRLRDYPLTIDKILAASTGKRVA